MRPSPFFSWFIWPAALFLATVSPPARGAEPADTVKNEDTPCEKHLPVRQEGLPRPILEFSLGPVLGSYEHDRYLGAQLALRALWRVSGPHLVGMMLERAVTLDAEDGGQGTLGVVGYRYAPAGRGVHLDLLPVYSRTQYDDGFLDGQPRYVQRKWIAPKLRAGFGGNVGGVRIGVAFEAVIDVSFMIGIHLFIGGIP